jgi:hypothetical protein
LSQVQEWKNKFEECKEIIIRNNYKIMYNDEMHALNTSMLSAQQEFNSKML